MWIRLCWLSIYWDLDKKIDNQTTTLKTSIDDALKQYSDNQNPQGTRRYDPSYPGPSTPFSPRSVEKLVNARRYYFSRDAVERMQQWSGNYGGYGGFQSAFPFIQPPMV